MNQQQEHLLMMLPDTEYGQAIFAFIQEEIDIIDNKLESGGKICNDPLINDFRCQLGMRIALKKILRKPQELKDQQKEYAK